MSRLVDVDELKHELKWLEEYDLPVYHDVVSTIDEMATVDTEPVVRCEDCIHYYADPWGWGNCVFEGGVSRRTKTSDFCSWGERREDDSK